MIFSYTYYNNRVCSRGFRAALCLLLALLLTVAALLSPATAFAADKLAQIDGTAAILVDGRTGTVLYEQNADEPVAPASTTKIMTALLVVEAIAEGRVRPDDMVELTDAILTNVPSDASRIGKAMKVGEKVSVRELLLMAMMESDCVACDMLAVHVSGSTQSFVELMNLRAKQLGCKDTSFLNSHGYPTEGHTSTARSLYLITAEASKYKMFMEAFSCLKYEMAPTNIGESRILYSTDKLLYDPEIVTSTYTVYFNEYVTGGKTGYSKASGNCLVSTAEKDGMMLISVVTGVKMKYPDTQTVLDAFTETDRMLKWGFANYSSHKIVTQGQIVQPVEVVKGEPESINAVCAETIYVTLEKGVSTERIQVTSALNEESVAAPVSAGDVLGSVSLVMEGKTVGSTQLLADSDSAQAAKKFKANVPLIIILSILVAAGAGFLVWYTNTNNILLLDLAMGKPVGGKKKTAAPRPAVQEERSEHNAEQTSSNPFDEFFARNSRDE